MPAEFDLSPDPRILPMLGEITLSQERCLGELIDNSVDGFLRAKRSSSLNYTPNVNVSIPKNSIEGARISVYDNGPGMSPETLQGAVKAGWTSNGPIENLGLFGMGFNIATARLGRTTTVWTTRAGDREWTGLEIDFDTLIKQKHFKTPMKTRPKESPSHSGTHIEISRLRQDHATWFINRANVTKLHRFCSRAYSSMLRENGTPIHFKLTIAGQVLTPHLHCVWDESRVTQTSIVGPVPAIIQFDNQGADRPFCTNCWAWLAAADTSCPHCENGNIQVRARRIHGWVGVQRYLDEADYGIDFIRNGRKIELESKDLFYWESDGRREIEYPIDDPRNRGRFVGEVHIDHCRVSYTKEKFHREDPAWAEMQRIVRGDGPLRPEKAKELGLGVNTSPLYRLFQAFRRSSPKPKVPGCWTKLLVVPENSTAVEYARKFHAGEAKYLSDEEWFKLTKEPNDDLLKGQQPGPQPPPDGDKKTADDLFGDPSKKPDDAAGPKPTPPARVRIASLSGEFNEDVSNTQFKVEAYSVTDAGMPSGKTGAFALVRRADGVWEYFVNLDSEDFESVTASPLTTLLTQLAVQALHTLRSDAGHADFAKIYCGLRRRYAETESVQYQQILTAAKHELGHVLAHLRLKICGQMATDVFEALEEAEHTATVMAIATRFSNDESAAVTSGRFLECLPSHALIRVIKDQAEMFFGGNYWKQKLPDVNGAEESLRRELREQVVRRYLSFVEDAIWATTVSPEDYDEAPREYKVRVAMSLQLMERDVPT